MQEKAVKRIDRKSIYETTNKAADKKEKNII